MSILDNLEEYIDFDQIDNAWNKKDRELCHYCQSKATYTDVAQVDKDSYDIVGICRCHLSLEASS